MLLFKDFFPPEVIAFTSERPMDFSAEKSIPLTGEQKGYLSSHLKFECNQIFNIRQMHGINIVVADKNNFPPRQIQDADSVITNCLDIPIAVRSADCVPIFLYDPVHKVIGLVHAGWKGCQKTMICHTIKKMKDLWGTETPELRVGFGPAISCENYEVGPNFKKYFPQETILKNEHYYLDLKAVNVNQMLHMNVKKANIKDCGLCTFSDNRFFSHRKEGEAAGRMLSIMMMKALS